jgi:hypothetical protein
MLRLVSGTVLLEIHVNIVHLRAIKQPLKIYISGVLAVHDSEELC